MRANSLRACVLATTLSLAAVLPAQAADTKAGRAKAVQCAACHGMNGLSTLPGAPSLAGQDEMYLGKALREFRNGTRKDAMMTLMSQPLTDEDIDNLAAYYSSFRVTVESPQ